MTTQAQRAEIARREAVGEPIVTLVMRHESFDNYRAGLDRIMQEDLDAMVDRGLLVIRD